MRMTKESLRRIVREAVKAKLARFDEGLINDLEKSSGVPVRPGRNVLWGYPVDIDDGDVTQGVDMRAVDRDASVGLLKRLRQSGFKARFDKGTGTISVDVPGTRVVGEAMHPRTEYDEHMEVIASAITHQLTEKLEDEVTFSNAGEMIMGSISDDELLRPSDYEGAEFAAKKIAEMVVTQLKDELERFATDMLHSLMEPS